MVLKDVCELDEEEFEHEHGTSSGPHATCTRLASLLVCKSWHRAACSPFYRAVILSTIVQARCFACTLTERSSNHGIHVRKLRFKGGFGSTARKILQATPNLAHLCLSLAITSAESSRGLCYSLPRIQPHSLRLYDFNNRHNNANTRALVATICSCIKERWTRLVEFRFPYELDWPWKEKEENKRSLLEATYCAPFLKTVHMPAPHNRDLLLPLVAKPTLCAIYSETPFGFMEGGHMRGVTDRLPIQQLELCHKILFPLPGPWASSRRPYEAIQAKSNNLKLMFRVKPSYDYLRMGFHD